MIRYNIYKNYTKINHNPLTKKELESITSKPFVKITKDKNIEYINTKDLDIFECIVL